MNNKLEISCYSCNADYNIKHDLRSPYKVLYCSFCGEELSDEIDLYDDYDNDYDEDDDDNW